MIQVKICSLFPPPRYVLRRIVQAAADELKPEKPSLEIVMSEVSSPGEIGRYATVLVLPPLVINEKVVCSARLPSREEVRNWLQEAALIDALKAA